MVGDQKSLDAAVRLPAGLRESLRQDAHRIIVVGARGWIGRTLLEMLEEAMGPLLRDRVFCFGSSRQSITLCSGTVIPQLALEDLASLDQRPTILFHLAFLTMDKVGQMPDAEYRAANQAISGTVLAALEPLGVVRLFVASSGAAAFADEPSAAAPLRLYGGLKRDDEETFAYWAKADPSARRAAICRIYSVSGPFINKHSVYALADLILRAQRKEPLVVTSPRAVRRAFISVEELISVAFAMLLADEGPAAIQFDSGGTPVELGELAGRIALLAGAEAVAREISNEPPNDYYGNNDAWQDLLQRFGLEHADLDRQILATANWLAALEEA